jgi:hypothetical protein
MVMAATPAIDAGERSPVALIVSGELGAVRRDDVVGLLDELFDRHTGLEVRYLGDVAPIVQDCRGAVGCIAARVAREARPRYVMMIFSRGAVLLDPDRDLELRTEWRGLTSAEEWRAQLGALLHTHLRSELESAGLWENLGGVDWSCDAAGMAISVDGRTIGTTQPGVTRIEGLQAGRRTFEISHPDYESFRVDHEVVAGEVTTISTPPLAPLSRRRTEAALLWSGVGLAGAGAALITYAIVHSAQSPVVLCTEQSCPGGPAFESLPGGVLTAPLGYSLVATGGVLSLGSLWTGADEPDMWILLGVSVAAGALSYGLSAAFNGDEI